MAEALIHPPHTHESRLEVPWITSVFLTCFGSVFVYFCWTASLVATKEAPMRICGLPLHVTDEVFAVVDGVVGGMCLLHLGYNLVARFRNDGLRSNEPYLLSVRFPVDILASFPGLIHCFIVFSGLQMPVVRDLLCACCVSRVLIPDRHFKAFRVMAEIMTEHKNLLSATAFVSGLLLIVCSTLLYYTEHDSPDEEMRDYYGSASRAIWAELINLHGEWVWCDYSAHGKAICTIIDFVAIGICMVPIAVFADGYSDRLTSTQEETSVTMVPWQTRYRPANEGCRQNIYDLLYSHLHLDRRHNDLTHVDDIYSQSKASYNTMRFVSTFATALFVAVSITLTLKRFDQHNVDTMSEATQTWLWIYYGCDCFCALFFLVELCLRCIATKGCHTVSIAGLCDIISLAALVATLSPMRKNLLHPSYKDENVFNDFLVPARLLRCFCVESYIHALHTVGNVAYVNRKPLLRSFYALVCIWYIFGTCLYLTEREWPGEAKIKEDHRNVGSPSVDKEDEEDDRSMQDRYVDILTGLQYAMVHITGDYPIADYKLASMPFHFVFCISGLICTAAFTGIFTAGFQNYLQEEHALKRRVAAQKRLQTLTSCVVLIQHRFRRLRRRRLQGSSLGFAESDDSPSTGFFRSLFEEKTTGSTVFVRVCNAALIINILNTMASSVEDIEKKFEHPLEIVEFITASIFGVEYVCRLLGGRPPFSNCMKPMRLLELFCLLPSFAYFITGGQGHQFRANAHDKNYDDDIERFIETWMIFRIIRIFDIPIIRREAKKTWRATSAAFSSLCMPLLLSVNIWIFSSSIFMWLECYYDGPEKDNMSTVPDTMYWTSIFIIGEWANVDFSFGAGSRICIFYCLVGVGLCAIPVGIIAESVQDSVKLIIEERQELARLRGLGEGKQFLTQQPQPLGGPMSSNDSYGNMLKAPPGPAPGEPRAEPQYMPRSASQETAMLVPRPPGALAQPPPQAMGGQGYGAPPASYSAQPGYGGPPPGYAGPPPGYAGQPPGYGGPPQGLQGMPPGYAGPQPGYGGPPGRPGMPGQPGIFVQPPSSGPPQPGGSFQGNGPPPFQGQRPPQRPAFLGQGQFLGPPQYSSAPNRGPRFN